MRINFNTTSKRNLEPIHENKTSYFGKAQIGECEEFIKLYSNGRHVATLDKIGETAEVYGKYTNDTYRHVKEFLKQYGFDAKNQKQIGQYII